LFPACLFKFDAPPTQGFVIRVFIEALVLGVEFVEFTLAGFDRLVDRPGMGTGWFDAALTLVLEAGFDGYVLRQAQPSDGRHSPERCPLIVDGDPQIDTPLLWIDGRFTKEKTDIHVVQHRACGLVRAPMLYFIYIITYDQFVLSVGGTVK
jgi:hypothetical protein